MPELTPMESLQPCLLDRLTDDAPGQAQESGMQRIFSSRRFVAAVQRDLLWLFNTPAHTLNSEIYEYPEVAGSVLNYGFRNCCGKSMSSRDVADMEEHIVEVIRKYEPRILAHTIEVQVEAEDGQLTFEIRGQLWAQPVPEELLLKTVVDLNTGRFIFGDQVHE
jgi:type VI secretion system protein ImpF